MTTPERIWAWQWQTVPMGQWGITASPSSVEYVRADLHDAIEAKLAKTVEALIEIIARWDTPAWKDVEHTAAVINRARAVLAEIEKGGV